MRGVLRLSPGSVFGVTTAFELASDLVDDIVAVNPTLATSLGLPGANHLWGGSFGPVGIAESVGIYERYEPRLSQIESDEPRQRLAVRVMQGAVAETRASFEAGDQFRELRHLGSPLHRMRSIFDVMPTSTNADRADIVARLQTMGQPLDDYRDLLSEGMAENIIVARRQVESVLRQVRRMAEDPASFGAIATKVAASGIDAAPVEAASLQARAALSAFADWLETEYLPGAGQEDAVGADVYTRAADRLVGIAVDPDEAYVWGWEEFGRLRDEMQRVADTIVPGASVEEVKEHLETSTETTVAGTDALLDFVERTLETAVDDLAGSHFDVPDLIRPLTVQLAPPGTPLGVYYMRPSEDFSRPGGVWYSIGSQEVFPLYQHVSTAYHEGFPGHHLQIATAMSQSEEISRFQRLLTWYPGYGEGWGMYAEVLMGELGYLEDPRYYFGMLAKQMYRTARVVVDIGLHLGKTIDPSSPLAPDEPWTFDSAVRFMREYGFRTPEQARDEVLRYLGWPGQAIAYKLGEREILAIRDATRHRLGPEFDQKVFHTTVLNHGAMRLDLLRETVSERLPG